MMRFIVGAAALALFMTAAACRVPAGDAELRATAATDGWAPVALETLTGRSWVLRAWDEAEPVPAEPRVTLQYADGRITGRSACNRYTGPVTAGAAPGAIGIGAIAGTRMMCPEPAHGIESRFLAILPRARELRVRSGRLAIVYAGQRGTAKLIFDETRAAAN
jgi:heat shock protein HslJ